MTGLEWIYIATAILLFVAFLLSAGNLILYTLCCLLIITISAVCSIVLNAYSTWDQFGIFVVGLFLTSFGMAGVRIMAERSVSLGLLKRIHNGESLEEPFREHLKSRPDDIVKHRLGSRKNGSIELTMFGRLFANITRYVSLALGMK